MERHRLTDEQWECIAGVFPPPAKTGHPPSDRRQMIEGILHILRTGAPWRDLPAAFGPLQDRLVLVQSLEPRRHARPSAGSPAS
jgi:transposase